MKLGVMFFKYSGIGRPTTFDIKMPSVISICVREPNYPFSSFGDSSLIKLGTKTEKNPAASPKINLPTKITY
jgi:hypothetical protein